MSRLYVGCLTKKGLVFRCLWFGSQRNCEKGDNCRNDLAIGVIINEYSDGYNIVDIRISV